MIPYTIFEMQTDREGKTSYVTPVDFTDEQEAWSAYYLTLSYAIKSTVYMHTVMLCTADGRLIDSKCLLLCLKNTRLIFQRLVNSITIAHSTRRLWERSPLVQITGGETFF